MVARVAHVGFYTLVFILQIFGVLAKIPEYQYLPSLREQAAIYNRWREERVGNIPTLLQKHGVDAWLISQREYAEDTAFWSMKSATQFSARRRTTSIFFAFPAKEGHYSYTWIDNTPEVWDELRHVLKKHNPSSIAVNVDPDIAFSSGLHAGESMELTKQLGRPWNDRLVTKPLVAVEYIATMPLAQEQWYHKMMETAWAIIWEGFSEKVITPDKSTTEDVEWWLRDKIQAMNFTTWFHPSVTILNTDDPFNKSSTTATRPISYGDVLHVDFGVTALGLNTDTQHLGYVLYPGETEKDIPKSLKEGLKKANRVQDIVKRHLIPGLSGNQILKFSRAQMEREGISGKIYCHPIGDWGHSAGTLIGMTNLQDGVPILGDLPLLTHTYYSIELYAEHFVPELNRTMNFYQEEDIRWDGGKMGWTWVYGKQENLRLIKTPKKKALNVQAEVQGWKEWL